MLGVLWAILEKTGILSEFIIIVVMLCGGSGIGALLGSPPAGCITGGVIYLIRCIYYIAKPKESVLIEGWDDGSTTKRTLSTASKGWAGIAMLVIIAIVYGIVAMCAR